METPDLTSFIVDLLSDTVTPNDIIMEIFDKAGLSWPKAEALVERVRAEHEYAPGLGSHSRPIDNRDLCNLFSNPAHSALLDA